MPTAAAQPVGEDQRQEQDDLEIVTTCDQCDLEIAEDDSRWYHEDEDETWCDTCADDLVNDACFFCDNCDIDHIDADEWHSSQSSSIPEWRRQINRWSELSIRDRYTSENGSTWCDANPPHCSECGDYLEGSDRTWWEPGSMCHYCIDDSDDEPEWDQVPRTPSVINGWSYVPEYRYSSLDEHGNTLMFGRPATSKTLYLGMELEMEYARDHAQQIVDLFGEDPATRPVYLKTDGSLMSQGLELVSHPGTFEWWMAKFDWDALGRVTKLGDPARAGGHPMSYDMGTTGIHIHLSSDAFTHAHLFKFLAFHYRNPTICQVVGQRSSTQYCSWSGWLQTRPDIIKFAKKIDRPSNRYVAVNLTEERTIELRYFRGNLSPARVRKNLQWVHAVYTYTKDLPAVEMNDGLRWDRMYRWLLERADAYPDLVTFLEERGVTGELGRATRDASPIDA